MIGPSSQQKVDPLHTAAAETQRLISVQDELTIASLCKGMDTTESENKSRELRVVLEGMKALDRRRADSDRSRAMACSCGDTRWGAPMFIRTRDSHPRSLLKALSWRITGSLDTFILGVRTHKRRGFGLQFPGTSGAKGIPSLICSQRGNTAGSLVFYRSRWLRL